MRLTWVPRASVAAGRLLRLRRRPIRWRRSTETEVDPADAAPAEPDANAAASRPAPPPTAGRHSQGLARRVRRDPQRRLGRRPAGIDALPNDPLKPCRQGGALSPPRVRPRSSWRRSWPCSPKRPTCPRPSSCSAWRWPAAPLEPPAIIWPRADRLAGQRAAPRQDPAGRRATPSPTQLRLALEPLVKVDDGGRRRSRFTGRAARCCRSKPGPRPPSAWPGFISSAAAMPMPAASPTRAAPARPATGRRRPPGSPASRRGG